MASSFLQYTYEKLLSIKISRILILINKLHGLAEWYVLEQLSSWLADQVAKSDLCFSWCLLLMGRVPGAVLLLLLLHSPTPTTTYGSGVIFLQHGHWWAESVVGPGSIIIPANDIESRILHTHTSYPQIVSVASAAVAAVFFIGPLSRYFLLRRCFLVFVNASSWQFSALMGHHDSLAFRIERISELQSYWGCCSWMGNVTANVTRRPWYSTTV